MSHLDGTDALVKNVKMILRRSNYYYAIERSEARAQLKLQLLLTVFGLGIQRLAIA
ncbi:MAG: hypothetical protein JWR25_1600 [Noviherbaspirillum sp.]|nr:hypothetical protein [Noviherbaspirillum sp.]